MQPNAHARRAMHVRSSPHALEFHPLISRSNAPTDTPANDSRLSTALIVLGVLGGLGIIAVFVVTLRYFRNRGPSTAPKAKKYAGVRPGDMSAASSEGFVLPGTKFPIPAFSRFGKEEGTTQVSSDERMHRSHGIGLHHPASKITPFGQPTAVLESGPRFAFTPGEGMRVASRDEHGGWTFRNPEGSFHPIGTDQLDPTNPSSPRGTSPIPRKISKDQEARQEKAAYRKGGDGYGSDILVAPPPAYTHADSDGSSYLASGESYMSDGSTGHLNPNGTRGR